MRMIRGILNGSRPCTGSLQMEGLLVVSKSSSSLVGFSWMMGSPRSEARSSPWNEVGEGGAGPGGADSCRLRRGIVGWISLAEW